MSGILEQLLAAIQANTAAIQATTGHAPGITQTQPQTVPLTQQYVAPPVQQPPSDITAEQITALIQPHIGNEAIKAALGATMRSMGINALPETQPHQYGALFVAFQGVLAQHGVGGTVAPSPGASII